MFNSGDFIYHQYGELFQIVQILQINDEDYLIKDFWESTSLEELSIRAWVKRMPIADFLKYSLFQTEVISSRDIEEIEKFLEIEKGLLVRKNRTTAMAGLVSEAMNIQNYENALELLTEWAMLDKYRTEIYLKREECLRKLGRDAEADYERHVYNTLTGK